MTFSTLSMPISGTNMLIRSLLLLSIAIVTSFHDSIACAETGESSAYEYSAKPWPIRYFLYVDDPDTIRRMNTYVAEINSRVERKMENSVYLHYQEFFQPRRIINTPIDEFGVVLLTFSPNGMLSTPTFSRFDFTAGKTELGNLVLLKNGIGSEDNKPYHFARWWELPGSHIMSPAVCEGSDSYRYKINDPKKKHYIGGFGCREWSAQLQDDSLPYIDVTSYYDEDYNIISDFVGWSGFENKPKPVIGKHLKTWVCLHECPNGEEPGIISNIEEWTKKHGFPMPVRPKRQPEFPDSMFKDIYEE